MKIANIRPKFVEYIPDQLENGILYVSERFRICSHKCCCGCGQEVITPLSPAEWKLTIEGELVSLWPSIGNWQFQCRSHYVIWRNQAIKAHGMTTRQIARVYQRDQRDLSRMIAWNDRAKEAGISLDGKLPGGVSISPQTLTDRRPHPDDESIFRALWRTFFRS